MSCPPAGEPENFNQPDYWTQLRRELRAWFKRNAPSLGELYEGAVEMVFQENFPGRVRLVSHAVREIRNRLPDVIAGPIGRGRLDYASRFDEIVNAWKKYGLPLDGSLPEHITQTNPKLPNDYVLIPLEIYTMVAQLVSDHEKTRETRYEKAKRLFEAIDPNNKASEASLRPRIEFWIRSTEWFIKHTHERGEIDKNMGAEELKERFEIFEKMLSSMIGEFFKTMEELDAILEEANS